MACPQCGHALEMIAVIEQPSVIEDILEHLDLWQLPGDRTTECHRRHPRTPGRAPPTRSPAPALPPETRRLPGLALAPAGSSRPNLPRRALLGRGPDLGRLSRSPPERIEDPCILFRLDSRPFLDLDVFIGGISSSVLLQPRPSSSSPSLDPSFHSPSNPKWSPIPDV